jgi:phage replication-related protein YjqB (UPF0714/DUF867 family)
MADKYADFRQLQAVEEERSFSIFARETHAICAVMAPHGGRIEPGTSEVARTIAGDDLSLYLFEGLKAKGNRDLHITSSRFDEPKCMHMLDTVRTVVTIHGERSDRETVFVGGLDQDFPRILRAELRPVGFNVEEHQSVQLQGKDAMNICNRGSSGHGIQLELSRGLRKKLFPSLREEDPKERTPQFNEFCSAVRTALMKVLE